MTRDIWVFDTENKEYKQLSSWEGENRNPVFDKNGDDFYYLTEESGSFNIFKSSLSNSEAKTQITSLDKHPVRFLTKAESGKLCFSYHGEIYTVTEGAQPEKVAISLGFDGRQTLDKTVNVNSGFTEASRRRYKRYLTTRVQPCVQALCYM